MIDCDTILELADNYAGEEVIDSLRKRIDSHLAACASCSEFYRDQREVAERLRQAQPAHQAGTWFTERLLSRLAQDNDTPIDRPAVYDPAQLSFKEI